MPGYFVTTGQRAVPQDINQLVTIINSLNSAATDSHISSDGLGTETISALSANPTAVTQAGSTSGSMTLYQPLVGIVKLALIVFSNFRNNGGSTQGLIPPVPFTGRSKVWAGALPSTGIIFQASGVSRTISIVTALSSSGGSFSNATTLFGLSQGEILGSWDGMIVPSGGSVVNDGVVVVLGT